MNKPIRLTAIDNRGACGPTIDQNTFAFFNLWCPGQITGSVTIDSGNWVIQPGSYFAKIFKTPVVGPDVETIITATIESLMTVPVIAGDGSLIMRIPENYTDAGVTIPNDGYVGDTSWLVWLPGVNGEAQVETAINSGVPQYGYVILADVAGGIVTNPKAKYCGEIACTDTLNECIANILNGLGIELNKINLTVDGACLPVKISFTSIYTGGFYEVYRRAYPGGAPVLVTTITGLAANSLYNFNETTVVAGEWEYWVEWNGSGVGEESNHKIVITGNCYSLDCADFCTENTFANGDLNLTNANTTIPNGFRFYNNVTLLSSVLTVAPGAPSFIYIENLIMQNSAIIAPKISPTYSTPTAPISITSPLLVNIECDGSSESIDARNFNFAAHGAGGAGGQGLSYIFNPGFWAATLQNPNPNTYLAGAGGLATGGIAYPEQPGYGRGQQVTLNTGLGNSSTTVPTQNGENGNPIIRPAGGGGGTVSFTAVGGSTSVYTTFGGNGDPGAGNSSSGIFYNNIEANAPLIVFVKNILSMVPGVNNPGNRFFYSDTVATPAANQTTGAKQGGSFRLQNPIFPPAQTNQQLLCLGGGGGGHGGQGGARGSDIRIFYQNTALTALPYLVNGTIPGQLGQLGGAGGAPGVSPAISGLSIAAQAGFPGQPGQNGVAGTILFKQITC